MKYVSESLKYPKKNVLSFIRKQQSFWFSLSF